MARSVLMVASEWSRTYSAIRSRFGSAHSAAMADTLWWQRVRWRSTGGCPRRLQERRISDAKSIADSSRRTMLALGRAALF
jgi:hypothetical protein